MSVEGLLSGFSVVYFHQIPNELFFGKRKDNKYIFHVNELKDILDHLTNDYAVVSHHEHLVATYYTRYLDSDNLKHYHDHLHGKMNRVKYRVRTYEDGKSYFEIKGKRNTGHTLKSRVELGVEGIPDSGTELEQLKEKGYEDQLHVRYDRITLYSKDLSEKITIDIHLHFEKDGSTWASDSLVIAESKMAQTGISAFRELMKALHIRESSFSKYCFGIATLVPSIKRNNFKQLLKKTDKIISKYEISSNHI